MSLPTVVEPTGVEKTFDPDEIIVSKTDLAGHITYVNHVFTRVSGYEPEDLLGRPHNVIRHPAMPAGVFRLLWETIAAGSEIYAYVLNLARDGAHYWVLAHVTPTRNRAGVITGYHSNRRSPSPSAVAEISGLYERLRAAESGVRPRPAAAARGAAELAAALGEARATYDEFVWDLIARHDAGRHDAVRHTAAHRSTFRDDAGRHDAAHRNAFRDDAAHLNALRDDAGRHDAGHHEAVRHNALRDDAGRHDAGHHEAVRHNALRDDAGDHAVRPGAGAR